MTPVGADSPEFPARARADRGEGGAAEPSKRQPFTIVLPVFNEEGGLVTTLAALRSVLPASGLTYEIIMVDDGSTDATPRLLAACTDVRVIRHPENRGYGAALKTGIRAASHPLVVVMDADATYAAAAIPALVEACARADMVVGARIGQSVQPTPARSAVKWWFRQFAQWITGASIPDLNSGLRVFRRTVAERFMTVLPDGFSFTTTITVASTLEGLVVRFAAVDYMPRIGKSKLRPVRDTLRIARQLLRLGLRFAPLRTSMVLAFPLLVAFVGASSRQVIRREPIILGDLGWLVAGVATLAAGLRAEQQVRRQRRVDTEILASRDP